ncbi:MAG: 1-acyl-sn-glycerol-3-phosphate acyltransferase, partial [Clostridiales bacterium]|nr:1-acyl-sn-glycerol-3-phosphate acyltransferase [Clostridiales bacterium]
MADNEKTKEPPKRKPWVYSVFRGIITVLFRTIFPVKVIGREILDQTQAPYIFLGNHKTWIDPVCMAYGIRKKQITFLAKKELFQAPLLGRVLYWLGAIPVDRKHSDMKAIRLCLNALKNNEILGIFPEGTRHKEGIMEEIEGGVAIIALRSQVPLIPMYISHPLRFFHKNYCYVGSPIQMDDLIEKGISKETTEILLDRIRNSYRLL